MNKLLLLGRLFAGWLFLLMSLHVHAEPVLSMNDAIALATQNQPLLQSLDYAASASQQAAVAEGQLPDPKLKFGLANLPVTTSDAFHIDRDDQTTVNVGISQDMVPQKRREAAANRLQAEAEQFHTEQAATASVIQRDVALAWLDVFEAQRKADLYQRLVDEMTAERKVALARVSSGGSQALDVLRLDTQLAMTNDKRLTSLRDEQKARAVLSRWIGKAALQPLPEQLPAIPAQVAIAAGSKQAESSQLEQHPALENVRQAEKLALSDVDSAKALQERNWSWELGYGKRFADRSDMLSFQVAIDLQLDRANRQDRRTAEKLVLVEKARKMTEDRQRELVSELDAARADWQAAEAREAEHQQRLIPIAEARLSIIEAGYAAGKQPLADVWEARRGVLEVELDHWGLQADRQRAAVRIAYLLNNNSLFAGSQP
ncbi:MAG TPA: TolC family protein [Methylophilaceae bacterium]|jgi:outer membrane protein TolC